MVRPPYGRQRGKHIALYLDRDFIVRYFSNLGG